jgi:hypothetical protein
MRKLFREYDAIHSSSGKGVLDVPGRRPSGGPSDDLAVCFREVPEIFFRPDFSLQSPELFNLSIGAAVHVHSSGSHDAQHNHYGSQNDYGHGQSHADNLSSSSGGSSGLSPRLGTNRQEQLSRYLDLVEVALLKLIWTRSPAFFRALDDIKGLQFQVSRATASIRDLRDRLQTIDGDVALGAMRIPQMHRRQSNEAALHRKLSWLVVYSVTLKYVFLVTLGVLALSCTSFPIDNKNTCANFSYHCIFYICAVCASSCKVGTQFSPCWTSRTI